MRVEKYAHTVIAFGALGTARVTARAFIKLGIEDLPHSWLPTGITKSSNQYHTGALKGSVSNMTHTLVMEWAEHGIREDNFLIPHLR